MIPGNTDMSKLLQSYMSETPNTNLCWNLICLCPTKLLEVEVDCPGWKTFQANLKPKHNPVSTIGYGHFLPASPTFPAVAEEELKICMGASKKLGMTHTVVTQDEVIYELSYSL